MKHNFEERKQNRIDYAKKQAEKNKKKSEALHRLSDEMASHIPAGQPILIGHHSEKADRRYCKKMRNTFVKAIEASDKAAYYTDKAKTIERNNAISSDDPNVLQKLVEKISKLEKKQHFMKEANRFIRKKDKDNFMKLEGTSEQLWQSLIKPDCFGRLGFASFELTNNNINIRRLKLRREELQLKEGKKTESETIKGIKLVRNIEANRVQLIFPQKPSKEICIELSKRYHFHYCKLEDAWQRHLNNAGLFATKQFLDNYKP